MVQNLAGCPMFKKPPPPENEFQTRVRAYLDQRNSNRERVYPVGRNAPPTGGRRLRALIMILAALFVLKSTMIFFAGPNVYLQKLQPYADSSAFYDQAIVFVLQPDPATSFAADILQRVSVKARSFLGIYVPSI